MIYYILSFDYCINIFYYNLTVAVAASMYVNADIVIILLDNIIIDVDLLNYILFHILLLHFKVNFSDVDSYFFINALSNYPNL